ncbi:MAG: ABC transporter substrate-binding protein [Anaerolineae bacterium]|nr:ABC transporter substrate-binding protein [Anaerolineae bacterium]
MKEKKFEYDKQQLRKALTRRDFLRYGAGFGTLLTLGPLISACSPATPAAAPVAEATTEAAEAAAASGPKIGGTLVFAAESVGESLEPGLWNGFGVANILDNVCDGLTRPSSTNWTDPAEPALAESWEVSEDGLTYTFKIREGVKFQDGADLNAEAIVRSLTRQTNEADSSYVPGLYMYVETGFANWDTITAEDEYTVKLVLKSPDAAQLHRLFHPAAVIVSPKALDEFGADINVNLVGCGPFKVDKFTPGQEITLSAFEDYWDGRPPLDSVVIRGYPDEGAMLAAIESGEVNFAPYPPSSAVERLKQSDKVKVEAGPPLIDLFLGCCELNAPMDNKDIRLAINYAVNRENAIAAVLNGLGELPATLVGPTEFGFDPSGREISTQDLDKAKEHIEKSGLSTPIELTLSYEDNRFWPQMAELVKSDLEAVGFSVTLDRLDAGSYWGKVLGGESQLNMNQRSLWVPDPDNKVRLLHSSQATAQFETGVAGTPVGDKFDELIDAGRSETDETKRAEIYKEIQDLILEEMPYVMLAYYTKPVVMAQNVMNVPIAGASTERIFLNDVWIDS